MIFPAPSDQHRDDPLAKRRAADDTDDDVAARLATRALLRIERTRSRRRTALRASSAVAAAAAVIAVLLWALPRMHDAPCGVEAPIDSAPPDSGDGDAVDVDVDADADAIAGVDAVVPERSLTPTERLVELLDGTSAGDWRELRRMLAEPAGVRILLDVAATAHGARRLEESLVYVSRSAPAPIAGDAVRELAGLSARIATGELWRGCSRFEDDGLARHAFLLAALRGAPAAFAESLGSSLRRAAPRLDRRLAVLFARAVAQERPDNGWAVLEPLLRNPGSTVAAIDAAGALGDPRALPHLERFAVLADERAIAAVTAIGRVPGERAAGLLVSIHRHLGAPPEFEPGFEVLRATVRAIRSRQDDTLAELRRRAELRLDAVTIDAVVALFPEIASAELARWLESASRRQRPQVCRALAMLGDRESFETLVAALDDPALARVARKSLARLARRDLGPRSERWRRWWHDTKTKKKPLKDRAGLLPRAIEAEALALARAL